MNEDLDFGKLDYQELGFIWHAYFISQDAMDQYCLYEDLIPKQSKENFPFDFLVPNLKIAQNWEYPVKREFKTENFGVMNTLRHSCMEPKNYDDFFVK